jgi:hypothetical protein
MRMGTEVTNVGRFTILSIIAVVAIVVIALMLANS